MTVCDLANRDCVPCQGGMAPMEEADARAMMAELHPGWRLDGGAIERSFAFKGFAKAVSTANLAAWLGDKLGHHPDIAFGWGYARIRYTTHEIGGLSENDFIAAARLDALMA